MHLFHKWGKWVNVPSYFGERQGRMCEICHRTQFKWAKGN